MFFEGAKTGVDKRANVGSNMSIFDVLNESDMASISTSERQLASESESDDEEEHYSLSDIGDKALEADSKDHEDDAIEENADAAPFDDEGTSENKAEKDVDEEGGEDDDDFDFDDYEKRFATDLDDT